MNMASQGTNFSNFTETHILLAFDVVLVHNYWGLMAI